MPVVAPQMYAGVENTEEHRRLYREILFTTPGESREVHYSAEYPLEECVTAQQSLLCAPGMLHRANC